MSKRADKEWGEMWSRENATISAETRQILKEAAGSNRITGLRPISNFTDKNEIESARFYMPQGVELEGTYDIISERNGDVVREKTKGYIIKNGDRAYGVNIDGNKYRTTDLRTGMLIDGNAQSFYGVKNAILLFQDHMSHGNFKDIVKQAEERFKKQRGGKT
jgi:hypothetical protein